MQQTKRNIDTSGRGPGGVRGKMKITEDAGFSPQLPTDPQNVPTRDPDAGVDAAFASGRRMAQTNGQQAKPRVLMRPDRSPTNEQAQGDYDHNPRPGPKSDLSDSTKGMGGDAYMRRR